MNKALMKTLRILPDKLYLQLMYYHFFHKFINFKNPVTYNEKLQWLKVNYMRIEDAYDRDNIFEIVDRRIRKLFDELISDIRTNRTDAIITERTIIMERLDHYKTMARV